MEILEEISERGYAVIDGVLGDADCDALVADLERLERELGTRPSGNSFEGRATTRVYNLLAHGPLWEAIPVNPSILGLADGVLGAGCLVSSLSSVSIGPGETAQPIHADDQLLPIPKPHPPTVFNSMWALTDFTDANGATRVIPASHLRDHSPDYGTHYESISAEMPRGSVLVWHGSLWHGGGANRTDDRRVGIAMNYCAGYLRQQENQQLGLARATVARFAPRLRELVGYGVYNGLIGHVDRRSPAELLLGGDREPVLWERQGVEMNTDVQFG